MRRALLAGLLIFASADRAALAQVGSVCGCPDVNDLINRLNMAEAARAALNDEIPKIEAKDRENWPKPPAPLDDTTAAGISNQEMVRTAITNGMVIVQALGAPVSEGRTNSSCRSFVTKSSTACMDEIVKWHEDAVHVPACKKGPTNATGLRVPQTTAAYAREEIAGYESEIKRILEILQRLPATCRPSGWIGHIYYFETKLVETQRTMKPGRDLVSGSESSNQTMVREAKILYREPSRSPNTLTALVSGPRMFAVINETYSTTEKRTAKWGCTGGFSTPVADRITAFTLTQGAKIEGSRETEAEVGFSYEPSNDSYSVSFNHPGMVGSATSTRTETVNGSCNPGEDGTKSSSAGFSQPYESSLVRVSGRTTPRSGTDVIQGDEKLNLTPPVSMPDLSIVHTGTLRFTFFRVP